MSWPASKLFGGASWDAKENFPVYQQSVALSPANTPSNERRKVMQYQIPPGILPTFCPCQSPTPPIPPLHHNDQVAPHQSPRRRHCTVSTGMPLATRQGCEFYESLAAGLLFRLGLSLIPGSSRRRTHNSIPYRCPLHNLLRHKRDGIIPQISISRLLMQRLFDNLCRQSFWNIVKHPCSDLRLPRKEVSK